MTALSRLLLHASRIPCEAVCGQTLSLLSDAWGAAPAQPRLCVRCPRRSPSTELPCGTARPRLLLQQRTQGAAQATAAARPAGAGAAGAGAAAARTAPRGPGGPRPAAPAALTAQRLPACRKRRRLLKVAQIYSPLVAAALLAALCATGGLLGTRATHWHREARKLEAHLAAQRNEITHLQARAPPRGAAS